MQKAENKKKNTFKYTIIVIVMFVVGLVVGIIFSNISNSKENTKPVSQEKGNSISEERAKEIALEDAKKDFSKEVTLDTDIYVKLDKEDGIDVYEVSFIISGVDYDYEIRVSDGAIIDKDRDLITNNNSSNISSNSNEITLEQAKTIALKDIHLNEENVTFIKNERNVDHGITIYEIKFSDTTTIYDYEVNATSGEIVSKEVELKNKNLSGTQNITDVKAKEIALTHSGLKESEVTIKKVELENETNYKAYEVDFLNGNKEYDYEIHVSSGTILKYSWKVK